MTTMDAICLITSVCLGLDDLREFVEREGGYWLDDRTVNRGVFERGRDAVFVALDDELSSSYEPTEIDEFRLKLGSEPRVMVVFEMTSSEAGLELARRFAARAKDVWGGLLDP